jgi:hypothetical protein
LDMLETTEMGEPEHRDHFCDAFEAALRRDVLWHRKIADSDPSIRHLAARRTQGRSIDEPAIAFELLLTVRRNRRHVLSIAQLPVSQWT